MRFRRDGSPRPFRSTRVRRAAPPPAADLDLWLALTDSAGLTAHDEIGPPGPRGGEDGGVDVAEADPRPMAVDLMARLFVDGLAEPEARSGPAPSLPAAHPAVERRERRFNRLDPRLIPRSVWVRSSTGPDGRPDPHR
ncbi:MAG: hypothetical protein ACK5PP_05670 [Acidimicrobiales bacterium]